MPDTKISALTAGGSAQAADEFPIARSGSNFKILGKDLGKGLDTIVCSGLSLTGSQATTLADLAATWNTTGTPTAIKLNITDTASNANSLFIDIQKGGSTHFSVSKSGVCYAVNGFSGPLTGNVTGNVINGSINGDANKTWQFDSSGIGGGRLRFDTSGNMFFGGTGMATSNQPAITADTTHILAQRVGTNAQTFRLYKTFTDASNYERLTLTSATHSSAVYMQLNAESAGTGAANIGIVLSPKGTGAFTLQMPDGTTAGGNARGNRAVDFSTSRGSASNVASGADAFVVGVSNTASGQSAVAVGYASLATNSYAVAIGYGNTASDQYATAIGEGSSSSGVRSYSFGTTCTASGERSVAIGYQANATGARSISLGIQSVADKSTQFAIGGRQFAAAGDCQWSALVLSGATTNNSATEIFLEGASAGTARATVPANRTWMATVSVIARSQGGTDNAAFVRRCIIKRDGSNNTALVGSVQTLGTDIGSNGGNPPAGWAVTITADDTNESLKVEVTGATSTNIRWVAKVDLVEVGYP